MTFATIGQIGQTAERANQNADGNRHGEIALQIDSQQSSEIVKWLTARNPVDADKAAVLRAQQHGAPVSVKYEGRYPTGPNGEALPSYVVAVSCRAGGTDEQRQAALADLMNFQTPAPQSQIEAWLAELSVVTAGKGRQGFEAELALTAYTSRLAEYPADVVRQALLGQSWKWFPTWAELERICEALAGPRRQMIRALSQPVEPEQPKTERPDADGLKRSNDLVARLFPGAAIQPKGDNQ